MKVAWKVVRGHGPYAYLQESVWKGDGKVVSKHIKYLGPFGKSGVFPGKRVKGYPKVRILSVPPEIVVQLKAKPAEKVMDYHNKLKKKMGSYEISDDDMNQWLETVEAEFSPEEMEEFERYDPLENYPPIPANIPDIRRDLSYKLEEQASELDKAESDVKALEGLYESAQYNKKLPYLRGLSVPQIYSLIAYGKGDESVLRGDRSSGAVADYWSYGADELENIEAPELLGELLDLGRWNPRTKTYERKRTLRDVQGLFGAPMTLGEAKARRALLRSDFKKTKRELEQLAA